MQKPSPIFLKQAQEFYNELEIYERKIRMIQNEFAGNLKQEDATFLLEWISIRQKLRMRN